MTEPIVRRVARVIVIDSSDRVLLLAARDPSDSRVVWFAPGGGVEADETLEQAAARELVEEIGSVASGLALLGPIWTRRHAFTWNGTALDQRETFFAARLEVALDPATIRPEPASEAQYFAGARWATVDEIAGLVARGEIIAPRRLPELLAPILAGELPVEPIDTGV
jgi:8-oxo-dGTP pyrophosphatase MutT (NUDIX family)